MQENKNIFFRIKRKSKKILREYFLSKEFIYKSKYGFKIMLNCDKDVDRHFYWNSFEEDGLEIFSHIIKNDDIVFDIGANIGIYTLIASVRGAEVHSFEPSDWANNRLRFNIELNKCENIIVNKSAVGDNNRTVKLFQCDDDAYNSINEKPMNEVTSIKEVEMQTISTYCKEKNIAKIDLLKIDVEGADYLVLKGGEKYIYSEESPIVFCEYNQNFDGIVNDYLKKMKDFMKSAGYGLYILKNRELISIDHYNGRISEVICLKPIHKHRFNSYNIV